MARGNSIIVATHLAGKDSEGVILTASRPGTICVRDATVSLQGGRHSYRPFDGGADGALAKGGLFVLLEDELQGKDALAPYTAGSRAKFYKPEAGEEVNLLIAGTANIALNAGLVVAPTTGQVKTAAGTEPTLTARALEAFTSTGSPALLWCEWAAN